MPSEVAERLSLLSDGGGENELDKWCDEAIATLTEEAQAARRGNLNVVNKLVGYVMKLSRGTADAKATRARLLGVLSNQT